MIVVSHAEQIRRLINELYEAGNDKGFVVGYLSGFFEEDCLNQLNLTEEQNKTLELMILRCRGAIAARKMK